MLIKCDYCKSEFNKSPNQIAKTKHNYCSKKCSGLNNNKLRDKSSYKPLQGKCTSCGVIIPKRYKSCNNCSTESKTLKDLISLTSHRANAYGAIRGRARTVAKKLGWCTCFKCGYSNHVEISHIKAISDFSEDTPIEIINHPDNLIALCSNCHWEADHNLFDSRLFK